MDTTERQERKREAWRRLRAQRRRAGELRGRVVAISLVGFALLWAIVFTQMATGNDPVLSAKASALGSSATGSRGEGTGAGEAESRTESEQAERAEEEALEAVEEEAELLGPQAPETEFVEPEIVVEPEPIITGQS
jgi:hypothetical protein